MARRVRVAPFALAPLLLLGACGSGDVDYYPLRPGLMWEYSLKTSTFDGVFQQKQIVRNLGESRSGGETVYVQEQSGNRLSYYRRTAGGIERLAIRGRGEEVGEEDKPGHYLLRLPYAVGTRWSLPSHLSLIQARSYEPADRVTRGTTRLSLQYEIVSLDEAVDVPAGHYAHCLKTRATGGATIRVDRGNHFADVVVENFDWYAPGVGLVKSTRVERSDSHYLQAGEYLLELERML